jgi:PAS domain S-box-containing protein
MSGMSDREPLAEPAGDIVTTPPAAVPDRMLDALGEYALVALNGDGLVHGFSTGAQRLTGYSEAQMSGQPFSALCADATGTVMPRLLDQSRAQGGSSQERWWRRHDGGLIRIHEMISPVADGGYLVIGHDITRFAGAAERPVGNGDPRGARSAGEAALQSELEAAERRAAFLAEASSILVATSLDFDSTLKALARLAVSRLAEWCVIHSAHDGGLARAELAHRDPQAEPLLERAVPRTLDGDWSQAVHSVISTGQAQALDGIARAHASGAAAAGVAASAAGASAAEPAGDVAAILAEIRAGSVMITPLLGRGRVLGAITFVAGATGREYDDDDLSLAEELGRRAAIALDNARLYREAQEANRAKADFLAVISHELRTPLNAIMGYSDLLDAEISGNLSAKQRRQVDRIRASARHLLQLIEEILSFARIEAGGEEVTPDLTDAVELGDEALAVIEPMADAKGLTVQLHVPQQSLLMETDAGKARQVLVNLLSNAVKFTERGGVTLSVERRGEHVHFEVSDTGIGINSEQMAHIFDPFWQAERPNTRRVGGTGLGLAVSRRYVRLLHGDLTIDSAPGQGTRVSVVLPLRLTGERAGGD